MTIQQTGAIMDTLGAAYPAFYARQTEDQKYNASRLWATMFADYPVTVVLAAVQAFIATDEKGYPPAIGQIMGKIRTATDPERMTEQAAWSLVKRAVKNGIYGYREEWDKLTPEIQSVIHAPEVLREWATIPEDELDTVISSNFQRSYRAVDARQKELAAIPQSVRTALNGYAERMTLHD